MSEEDRSAEDVQLTFKVKTSSDGLHNITIAETATVLDLKTKLAGADYENIPADRQRLIYSGRVLKNEELLSAYKIKAGNTIHMVKSAASNAAQNPANAVSTAPGAAARAAPGVPVNMAAGTANNPLANLTGARYAGQINLPSRDMFGVDGGVRSHLPLLLSSLLSFPTARPDNSLLKALLADDNKQMGAPPNEDQMADMLSDPATAQMMNEALSNPQMVDMMINSNPTLRAMGPAAREMLQSPFFRQMMTDPNMIRQAARMQRQMSGGAASFPAPGITDTTPSGAAGSVPPQPSTQNLPPLFGGPNMAANPFASLFGPQPGAAGAPASTSIPGQPAAIPPNPFAAMFQNAGAAGAGPGQETPAEGLLDYQTLMSLMQQQNVSRLGGAGAGAAPEAGAAANPFAMLGDLGRFASPPPPPADTRPPEEVYATQLRALNDMGFFDFEQNVTALRRSGGSVEGAVEQLLR